MPHARLPPITRQTRAPHVRLLRCHTLWSKLRLIYALSYALVIAIAYLYNFSKQSGAIRRNPNSLPPALPLFWANQWADELAERGAQRVRIPPDARAVAEKTCDEVKRAAGYVAARLAHRTLGDPPKGNRGSRSM